MNKRFCTAAAVLLVMIITGCAPVTPFPNGSETTGVPAEKPVTGGETPVSPDVQAPSRPIPDPAAVSLRIEPAYPKLTFDQPLYITGSGDERHDVYVVERSGRIRIFADHPDTESAGVFLDIRSLVYDNGQEQGLLGLAFHPDYAQNGYFYVNYTNQDSTVVARYTRQTGNKLAADPESGVVLLTFKQPYANHNGGHLAFGPDKYLYIATGDGGSGGDPQNNGQNLKNLLGKILRIDVDRPSGGAAYSIPADNPFAGNDQGYRPEIFAYGLRNPWRFSFDSWGFLWAADVGQNRIEEIDLIVSGGNYGWRIREGTEDYKPAAGVDDSSLMPPVWEYDHALGSSITGGYVYEGSRLPGLQGAYIYGDFVSGRIWALWSDASQTLHNTLLLETDLNIASFGRDDSDELWVVDLGGKIYRLTAAN